MDYNKRDDIKMGPIIKSGAVFGVCMGLIMGLIGVILLPFAACVTLELPIILGIIIGAVLAFVIAFLTAVLSGFVFGLFTYIFAKNAGKSFEPLRDSFIAEKRLFYDGAANHLVNKESVGGWMFLLEDSLYYKSHLLNNQVHEFHISLRDIRNMQCPKKFLNDTSLDIILADGRVEKFAVNDPKTWAAKIDESCRRIYQNRQNA